MTGFIIRGCVIGTRPFFMGALRRLRRLSRLTHVSIGVIFARNHCGIVDFEGSRLMPVRALIDALICLIVVTAFVTLGFMTDRKRQIYLGGDNWVMGD